MKISFVFLTVYFYYWVCLVFRVSGHSVHCIEDQKVLLLQLKKNLKFNSVDSNKLVFWNESVPCSEWSGVTWDDEGHISGLDLSEQSISGGLDNSSSLFSLQYLKHLSLAFNNFSSMIPSRIKDLKSLTSLNLSNAGFVGQIPMEIAQLTRLAIIDLSTLSNYLEESVLKLENPNMVKLVQNLSEVRELYLDGIHISLNGNEWGPALSSSLPNLQVLSMSRCNLSGPIDSSLQNLQNLSIIHLDNNFLSTPVPDLFAKLSNLTQLSLNSCNLSGMFPNQIFQVQSLAYVDLSENVGLQGSLPHFPQNGSLRILILSNTNFSGELPDSIGNIPHLSGLNISRCHFSGILPYSMSDLIELTYMDLSFNYFTGPMPPFGMPKKLTYIDLSNNNFSSIIPRDIVSYLSFTIFLSLSHNALYGRIPDSICNASYIQVLDLSYNNFSGVIPHCLAKVETLGILNLGKNNLSGNIPDSFQASCTLKTLDLSSNNLQGPIPKSLSNCTTLEVLDIGNNNIYDQFPCLLKRIPTLQVMVLQRNNFHGPIRCPNMKRSIWKKLRSVDISFNNFNGTLPGEFFATWKAMMLDGNDICFNFLGFSQMNYEDRVIVNMKGQGITLTKILNVLPSIDFSSNHIEGSIPKEMMDFTALRILNLSNNNLLDHIPSSIWKLQVLESLDLSKNHLTGEIPPGLANLSFLSFLDLSYNHLVGEIPTASQLQTFEPSCFQGNDGLYGPPLTQSPNNIGTEGLIMPPPPPPTTTTSGNDHTIDLEFIVGMEIGVTFGLGIIVGPLFLWKKWRIRYWKCVDFILCSIFPQMYVDYRRREGRWFRVLRWSH